MVGAGSITWFSWFRLNLRSGLCIWDSELSVSDFLSFNPLWQPNPLLSHLEVVEFCFQSLLRSLSQKAFSSSSMGIFFFYFSSLRTSGSLPGSWGREKSGVSYPSLGAYAFCFYSCSNGLGGESICHSPPTPSLTLACFLLVKSQGSRLVFSPSSKVS